MATVVVDGEAAHSGSGSTGHGESATTKYIDNSSSVHGYNCWCSAEEGICACVG